MSVLSPYASSTDTGCTYIFAGTIEVLLLETQIPHPGQVEATENEELPGPAEKVRFARFLVKSLVGLFFPLRFRNCWSHFSLRKKTALVTVYWIVSKCISHIGDRVAGATVNHCFQHPTKKEDLLVCSNLGSNTVWLDHKISKLIIVASKVYQGLCEMA